MTVSPEEIQAALDVLYEEFPHLSLWSRTKPDWLIRQMFKAAARVRSTHTPPRFSLTDPNVETLIADIRERAEGWCEIDASTLLTLCDGIEKFAARSTHTPDDGIPEDPAVAYLAGYDDARSKYGPAPSTHTVSEDAASDAQRFDAGRAVLEAFSRFTFEYEVPKMTTRAVFLAGFEAANKLRAARADHTTEAEQIVRDLDALPVAHDIRITMARSEDGRSLLDRARAFSTHYSQDD